MSDTYYPTEPLQAEGTSPQPSSFALVGKERVLAMLMLLASIISVDFALFGGFNAGYPISMILTTAFYLLFAGKARKTIYSYLCIATALAGSITFAVYNDGLLLFGIFCMNIVLLATAISERSGVRRHSSGSFRCIVDILYIIFVCPFRFIGSALRAFFARRDKKSKHGGVFIGILCALPVILLITPLLISADQAFAKMLSAVSLSDLLRLFFATILGGVQFIFYFSHAYGMRYHLSDRKPVTRQEGKSIPLGTAVAFLGSISVIYVLYLISQITYFFSAFWGKMPQDFLPAEYARRGFAEMCIICTINLVLVFLVILFSRRKGGKIGASIGALCAFISLFSLMLIATVMAKIILYISRFGLTRLRILTGAFALLLAIIFLVLLLRLIITRLPYMRLILLSAAIICVALAWKDVDATIARYNISAYQSGALSSIDTVQLRRLSSSSVPYVTALLEDTDENVAKEAHDILCRHATRLFDYRYHQNTMDTYEFDIRHFNYSDYRAYLVLKEVLQPGSPNA